MKKKSFINELDQLMRESNQELLTVTLIELQIKTYESEQKEKGIIFQKESDRQIQIEVRSKRHESD
jgi:hypothetical protein